MIYTFNVVAPMNSLNNRMVSYNQYPIVYMTNKSIDDVLSHPRIREAIESILNIIGNEHIENIILYVRIIMDDFSVSDKQISLNKVIELWK